MRLFLILGLVILSLAGCVWKEGGGGSMVGCYAKSPDKADVLSSEIKDKLGGLGFASSPSPDTTLSTGETISWFYGSYRNSPSFHVKLIRRGAQQNEFRLEYEWIIESGISHQKEMDDKIKALNQELSDWLSKNPDAANVNGVPQTRISVKP